MQLGQSPAGAIPELVVSVVLVLNGLETGWRLVAARQVEARPVAKGRAGVRRSWHLEAGFGGELAAADAVLLVDVGLDIAVGEPGIEVRVDIDVAEALQHLAGQPVAAVGAEAGQGVIPLLQRPLLQGGVGALIKEALRFIDLTEQQLLTGEEDLDAGLAAVLEAFVGLEDPFRLALGEARGGQGKAREEVGGGRAAIAPAAEELHLLLSRQELADLLEERLELALGEGQIGVALEATALLHELLQQGDALLAGAAGGEVAADQIEHAIGQQFLEVLLELAPLLGLLAHALQQLQALLQG